MNPPLFADTWYGEDAPPVRELRQEVQEIYRILNQSYYGRVAAFTPSLSILPDGWTVTANGTGDFTVTHNLGTDSYHVFLVPNSGSSRFVTSANRTETSFDVLGWNDSGAATNVSFGFHVRIFE